MSCQSLLLIQLVEIQDKGTPRRISYIRPHIKNASYDRYVSRVDAVSVRTLERGIVKGIHLSHQARSSHRSALERYPSVLIPALTGGFVRYLSETLDARFFFFCRRAVSVANRTMTELGDHWAEIGEGLFDRLDRVMRCMSPINAMCRYPYR